MREEKDWELSEDYYCQEEKKELSLEDFISEGDLKEEEFGHGSSRDQFLEKTIQDVHLVLSLAQKGETIQSIAEKTGLEEQYVYNIQVCAQGFREDDEIAVAHLVLG